MDYLNIITNLPSPNLDFFDFIVFVSTHSYFLTFLSTLQVRDVWQPRSKAFGTSGRNFYLSSNMSSTPDSSQYDKPSHWNALVIASVCTICTLVFLLSYFLIFKQLILDIIFSRNRVRGRLLDGADTNDPSLQSHSRSFKFAHTLPVTQFKEKNDGVMNKRITECAVCLGEFKEGERLRHLPTCSHSFHVSCIDTWFLDHSNCPLCRSEVQIPEVKNECPIPVYNPLQTLRREEFFQERAVHYQLLGSEILQNLETRHETATDANGFS